MAAFARPLLTTVLNAAPWFVGGAAAGLLLCRLTS